MSAARNPAGRDGSTAKYGSIRDFFTAVPAKSTAQPSPPPPSNTTFATGLQENVLLNFQDDGTLGPIAGTVVASAGARTLEIPILPSTPQPQHHRSVADLPPAPLSPTCVSPCDRALGNAAIQSRVPYARGHVIINSDSDGHDDDSDSSLEELSSILFRKSLPSPVATTSAVFAHSRDANGMPPAKRLASTSRSSKGTASKVTMNIQTLLKEAQRSDRIIEGLRKPDEPLDDGEGEGEGAAQTGLGDRILQEVAGEERIDRARRAMERTGTTSTSTRWQFFDPPSTMQTFNRRVFPTRAAKGPWAVLANSTTREQTLRTGLPYMMLAKGFTLPDELFLWILDAVCAASSTTTRQECINMVCMCPGQVERLVTPELLDDMLRGLGASKHLNEHAAPLELVPRQQVAEVKRDWGGLISWLRLMSAVADNLAADHLTHALRRVLRLGVDAAVVADMDVLAAYSLAADALCTAVSVEMWPDVCLEVHQSLRIAFPAPRFQSVALLALPSTSTRIHELRRRLAIASFLDDPSLAHRHPDDVLTFASVLQRLEDDAFRITPKTDYQDLRALVLLLNLAVDDGSLVPLDATAEKAFNSDVDRIAGRLRAIWRSINDTGGAYGTRTDAKNALEWMQQRLMYTVRTRRPPKRDIYEIAAAQDAKDSVIRQKMCMEKFLGSAMNVDAA